MIYYCADDYGLCNLLSRRIEECAKNGVLNKISVLPNMGDIDIKNIEKDVNVSLHINLVEGKALSKKENLNLLTDSDGNFKYSFTGLLKLSIIKPKEFERQVYNEIKAQVSLWKKTAGRYNVLIDTHQHTHMIPLVFKALIRVINEENISVKYLRIPSEPILPFLLTPSLYFTYNPVNILKQWLLKFLWQINKKEFKNTQIPTALFFGILFSGKMDKKRVEKILPHYIKKANKTNMDIEVLFHPGYIKKDEVKLNNCNKSFEKFYYSINRKTEYDALISLYNTKKEECTDNAIY